LLHSPKASLHLVTALGNSWPSNWSVLNIIHSKKQ
jgi:hypothetical protein